MKYKDAHLDAHFFKSLKKISLGFPDRSESAWRCVMRLTTS